VRAVAAHRRRGRLRGSFTAQQIRDLWVRQQGRCAISGAYLVVTGYHIDHKVSLKNGGMNTIENLQLLAPKVNLRKGAA
jgi:5-methylcytosine-specific restriction endonuclease McrA